jgi:hypothetical protein
MNYWKSVIAVLLGLLLSATVCAAADDLLLATPSSTPTNQTVQPWPSDKLVDVGETTEPVITLLEFRINDTDMPGPRDMAFGPTWISVAATPFQLVVTSLLIVALAGLYLIRKRW